MRKVFLCLGLLVGLGACASDPSWHTSPGKSAAVGAVAFGSAGCVAGAVAFGILGGNPAFGCALGGLPAAASGGLSGFLWAKRRRADMYDRCRRAGKNQQTCRRYAYGAYPRR